MSLNIKYEADNLPLVARINTSRIIFGELLLKDLLMAIPLPMVKRHGYYSFLPQYILQLIFYPSIEHFYIADRANLVTAIFSRTDEDRSRPKLAGGTIIKDFFCTNVDKMNIIPYAIPLVMIHSDTQIALDHVNIHKPISLTAARTCKPILVPADSVKATGFLYTTSKGPFYYYIAIIHIP